MDDRSETRRFLDRHGMLAVRFDALVADLLAGDGGGAGGQAVEPRHDPHLARARGRDPGRRPPGARHRRGRHQLPGGAGVVRSGSARPSRGSAPADNARHQRARLDATRSSTRWRPGGGPRFPDRSHRVLLLVPHGDPAGPRGTAGHFSKEIRAPEVEGTLVGAGLAEALERAGVRGKRTTVLLNDTTATLLAGRSAAEDTRQYDGYVGYILGTGTNAAYLEASIPRRRVRRSRSWCSRVAASPSAGGGTSTRRSTGPRRIPGAIPARGCRYRRLLRRALAHGGAGRRRARGCSRHPRQRPGGNGDACGEGRERVPAPALRRCAAARRRLRQARSATGSGWSSCSTPWSSVRRCSLPACSPRWW